MVLLVDVSGSMRGERVRTAAVTVGALAAELERDDLAVVAFWSDAAVLSQGPNLAALNPKLAGKVAGPPEVIVARAVPAGDPAKGQL